MLKSAIVLLSGNSFFYLMLFVRNLLVARLISVENYGIASTFAISMAIVEMMSTLGLPQMMIQDEDGDNPRMQTNLHGFNFLRSLVSAVALLILAHPLAHFLGIPDLTWAYQLLAIVPVVSGLIHFDVYRLQRQMRYTPNILTRLLPTIVSVAALWPLHHFYGDYRVMLYSLLIQWVLTTAFSHLFAERPFRMTFDRQLMARAFRFGWPILLGGAVLFFIFNGEKLIVGRELGLEALALFSMGFTLTLTPTLVLETSVQSFFLPQLSKAQKAPERFNKLSMTIIQAYLLLGLVFVLGVLLLGGPVVHMLLGSKYQAIIPILPWLALVQVLRMFKAAGNAISLAQAQTENSMIASLPRIIALPFAWYAAITTGNLLTVIWIATIAEFLGFVISLVLIRWRLDVSPRPAAMSIAVTFIGLVLVGIHASFKYGSIASPFSQNTALTFILATSLIAPFTMHYLRAYVGRKRHVETD
ncbi:oligosaccharide flippase family protein [uncultured Aliiroseovarius sp.]|uniref:oligosaccharide flippase family protein n=1 Tax=uncultured Aliiroseovarius sp. TaxID=1658783 RepID=UPI002591BD6A|nr:oligosaccharide flippase family protein [uncultured Aliiroseovarius sp.]